MNGPRLTPREIERSVDALVSLRTLRRQPWDIEYLRPRLGGSGRPLLSSLQELAVLGLLASNAEGRWSLTIRGGATIQARASGDWGPLVEVTLASGGLEREIEAFLLSAEIDEAHARLQMTRARRIAPSLCTVLSWQPDWRDGSFLTVPRDRLDAAMAEAAMAVAEGRPRWVEEAERIGHRAEAYSLRLERETHGAHAVTHVAVDDDGDRFGYDIEESSRGETRRIEVKGSRSRTPAFTLSVNQLRAAELVGELYEVHFWGEIDVATRPRQEYPKLRGVGYPMIMFDPAGMIERGDLNIMPASWSCTLP